MSMSAVPEIISFDRYLIALVDAYQQWWRLYVMTMLEFGRSPLLWILCELFRQSEQSPPNFGLALRDFTRGYARQIKQDQLIQSYYAAEYLLELLPNLSNENLKHDYLNYLRWTEPIALMLGLLEDGDRAVQVVQLALAVDLQLGTKLVGAVQLKFQEHAVKSLIQTATELKISQALMIELLLQTQLEAIVEPLIKLLQDCDIPGQEMSIKIVRSKAIKLLIQDLKSSDVRMRAAEALGKIGSGKAIAPLIRALQDEYASVRGSAAEALGKIGNDKAVEALIRALKDVDSDVRGRASEALEKIASDRTVELLIQALQDETPYVRGRSAHVLGVLGKCGSNKALEFLIKTLTHPNPDVRGRVAEVLGIIGSDQAVDHLIPVLQDRDFDVCGMVADALGKIGGETAVAPLIQSLSHEDSYVRGRAAEALGKIGNEQAIASLIETLKDEDSNVRGNAAQALGKIGGDSALEPLLQVLKDEYAFVRGNAEESLTRIVESHQNPSLLSTYLPYLVSLIPTIASKNAISAIATIQSQCQYYNYDIEAGSD
jgi:HEAT repeat protein